MTITKFVHSCILVQDMGFNVLIDPGSFTRESHLLHIDKLPALNYIVITHEHPDHYDEGLLKQLSLRQPRAAIATNNDLASKLAELNLPNPIHAGSEEGLVVFEAPHEPLPLDTPSVANIGVHIADKLTHTGDSFAVEHCREILALPLTAPFASYKQALDVIVKLKPKAVLPLHDWEWHKAAREIRYGHAKALLKKHNIEFIELQNAEPDEL